VPALLARLTVVLACHLSWYSLKMLLGFNTPILISKANHEYFTFHGCNFINLATKGQYGLLQEKSHHDILQVLLASISWLYPDLYYHSLHSILVVIVVQISIKPWHKL
jgi:hypothetical protein